MFEGYIFSEVFWIWLRLKSYQNLTFCEKLDSDPAKSWITDLNTLNRPDSQPDGRDRVQPAHGPGRRRDQHHAGRTMLGEARGSRQSIIQSYAGAIRDNCNVIAVHG